MTSIRPAALMFTIILSSCGWPASAPEHAGEPSLPDLAPISNARILFAHQSVGQNILRGVAELTADKVALGGWPAGSDVPGLLHVPVGTNGDPESKLRAFRDALDAQASPIDVALVKFCYIDIDHSTDVGRVFAMYRERIEALSARHPDTTFVHVTVPLKADEGAKAVVKRLIGRGDPVLANVRRNEYNERLRAYAAPGTLFDLARIESTRPDGSRTTFEWGGARYEQLAPEYTSDGGHLNGLGARSAAAGLMRVLADAAGRRAPAPAAHGG